MSIRPNWIHLRNEAKCLILICVFHFLPSFFLIVFVFSWILILSWSRIFLFYSTSFFYFLVFFYEFPPLELLYLQIPLFSLFLNTRTKTITWRFAWKDSLYASRSTIDFGESSGDRWKNVVKRMEYIDPRGYTNIGTINYMYKKSLDWEPKKFDKNK